MSKNKKLRPFEKRVTKDFLYEQQEGQCAYCTDSLPLKLLTLDHIVPIWEGGTKEIENLALCCRWCNQTKSNAPVWKFKLFIEFLEGKRPIGEALGRAVSAFGRKNRMWLYPPKKRYEKDKRYNRATGMGSSLDS